MSYSHSTRKSVARVRVLATLKEYGGTWRTDRMAEWINAPEEVVYKVYQDLKKEGIMV